MAEGIMRGEGEETFAELVAYYEGRGAAELINIQGITFREKEKQILCDTVSTDHGSEQSTVCLWGY